MADDFKGYYDYLSEEVDKFKDEADDYILYLPGFFKLLCSLLNTPIKKEDRQKLACAMGYFVTPDDIVPEDIFGHIGYVDDVFICCHVLKEIEDRYGIDHMEPHWEYEDELDIVLDVAYTESLKEVEKRGIKENILRYVGLEELHDRHGADEPPPG